MGHGIIANYGCFDIIQDSIGLDYSTRLWG